MALPSSLSWQKEEECSSLSWEDREEQVEEAKGSSLSWDEREEEEREVGTGSSLSREER